MCDSTKGVVDSILYRLGNGSLLSENELEKTVEILDKKLIDLEEIKKTIEEKLEKSVDEINSACIPHFCSSDSNGLHCFLNNVLQATERKPGYEDQLLRDLVMFCNHNNIVLPMSSHDEKEFDQQSQYSLNTLPDEKDEKTVRIWVKIKTKLRNGVICLFKSTSSANVYQFKDEFRKSIRLNVIFERRLNLLKLLFCVHSYEEITDILQKIRQWEIEQNTTVRNASVAFIGDKESMRLKTVLSLEKLTESRASMFYEDFKLLTALCNDVHKDTIKTALQQLLHFYNENICICLKKFMNYHADSIASTHNHDLDALKFSASDLRNFVKVFYSMNKWSKTVNKIFACLKGSSSNQPLPLNMKSSKVPMSVLVRDSCEVSSVEDVWNWKDEFRNLSAILKQLIISYIQCLTPIIVGKNTSKANASNNREIFVSEKVLRCGEKYPPVLSYGVGIFISLINEVMVFSQFDDSDTLNDIRDVTLLSIIEAMDVCSKHYQVFLEDFHNDSSDVDTLYINLANLCFLYHQLESWEIVASGEVRRHKFVSAKESFKYLQEGYEDAIVVYHLKLIKSSIVHDAHSNNWEDEKPFFEGERCSFSIQMWNFYLRGLVHDLFNKLSGNIAKQIIKKICTDILTFFVFRYSYVKPSYRRVNQVKGDLLVLLHINRWLMNFLADDLENILCDKNGLFEEWNQLSNALFENLVVVASPLSLVSDGLYGGEKQPLSNRIVCWYNEITSSSTCDDRLLISFNILISQPLISFKLLMQILIMNNVEFPRLLMKHQNVLKEFSYEDIGSDNETLNEMFLHESAVTLKACDVNRFNQAVYHILLRIGDPPFINYLASIIKKDNSKSFKESDIKMLPDWLQLVAKDLHAFFCKLFRPVLNVLFQNEERETSPRFTFTKMECLPCDCPIVSQDNENKRFKSVAELLHQCLMKTLQMLNDAIIVIPDAIWNTLAYVKGNKDFTASWITQPYLGTKILACLLYNWLQTKENIELMKYDMNLTLEMHENIESLAELIWHVIFHLTHDVTENPKISIHIFKDLQKSAREINELLTSLDQYCNRDSYDIEQSSFEQTDVDIATLLDESSSEGIEELTYIGSLLKANQVVLKEILTKNKTQNIASLSTNQTKLFNPLSEFCTLGDSMLKHFDLMEKELDWAKLIPDIPHSKWKTLIVNRFEFQDKNLSILTPEEADYVEKIKAVLLMKQAEES